MDTTKSNPYKYTVKPTVSPTELQSGYWKEFRENNDGCISYEGCVNKKGEKHGYGITYGYCDSKFDSSIPVPYDHWGEDYLSGAVIQYCGYWKNNKKHGNGFLCDDEGKIQKIGEFKDNQLYNGWGYGFYGYMNKKVIKKFVGEQSFGENFKEIGHYEIEEILSESDSDSESESERESDNESEITNPEFYLDLEEELHFRNFEKKLANEAYDKDELYETDEVNFRKICKTDKSEGYEVEKWGDIRRIRRNKEGNYELNYANKIEYLDRKYNNYDLYGTGMFKDGKMVQGITLERDDGEKFCIFSFKHVSMKLEKLLKNRH